MESVKEFFCDPYVLIALWTLIPALELRASIPFGILVAEKPWGAVVLVAIVANILLGPIVFFLLDKFMHLLLHVGWINRIWERMIVKTQKKIHPLVEKYGIWGLGLFIGIPLPGSGVYSGAIGGYLLGFTKKEFYIATVLGVLMAATLVTIITLFGAGAFEWLFIKK